MKKFEKISYSEITTKKVSDNETSFSIAPLERGFANTLGNSIRRALLSSVSSIAPFAIKIEGVEHEFQTVKGVKQDVVEIILNIKKLIFEYNRDVIKDDEIIRIEISVKNGGVVTAKDILTPGGVNVVNQEQVIAELSDKTSFNAEIFLLPGRGFVSFEENKETVKKLGAQIDSKLKSGSLISVDSDYSPVERVAFSSKELNSASAIIQEELRLDVKTNGSVSAAEALAQAANILIGHLEVISNISELDKEVILEDERVEAITNPKTQISIAAMDLSVRSFNCLNRAGYNTLDDLSKLTLSELKKIKHLGKKSADEIIIKLAEHGVVLSDDTREEAE